MIVGVMEHDSGSFLFVVEAWLMIKAVRVRSIVRNHAPRVGYCVSIGTFQVDKLKNWIERNLSVNSYCWPEGGWFCDQQKTGH